LTSSAAFALISLVTYPQAEETMVARVKKACEDLGNVGTLAKEV